MRVEIIKKTVLEFFPYVLLFSLIQGKGQFKWKLKTIWITKYSLRKYILCIESQNIWIFFFFVPFFQRFSLYIFLNKKRKQTIRWDEKRCGTRIYITRIIRNFLDLKSFKTLWPSILNVPVEFSCKVNA